MSIIWVDDTEGLQMEAKKVNDTRQRLMMEYEKLIKSVNRNRAAAEEIKMENTEDEGDLATISHNKELLANLHESDSARLRFIRDAIKALGRGQYGECIRCGKDINEKRLDAVPWATTCIRCQEQTEMEGMSSQMIPAGQQADEPEL